MCASVGRSLDNDNNNTIGLFSAFHGLQRRFREQTFKVVVVENHVTHRLSSSFHSTLTKTPSSPIAPAEKNVWRRHCTVSSSVCISVPFCLCFGFWLYFCFCQSLSFSLSIYLSLSLPWSLSLFSLFGSVSNSLFLSLSIPRSLSLRWRRKPIVSISGERQWVSRYSHFGSHLELPVARWAGCNLVRITQPHPLPECGGKTGGGGGRP